MNEGVNYVKIQWIEFENLKTGLKIEKIYFNNDITLLVGLSGAGKTQILNVAGYSLNLAVHKNVILRPYRAGIGILIDEEEYEWFYEINKINENELVINGESKYGFSFEKSHISVSSLYSNRSRALSVEYRSTPSLSAIPYLCIIALPASSALLSSISRSAAILLYHEARAESKKH